MSPILNIAFYCFLKLSELGTLRAQLRELCQSRGIRGTVLLSPEGINGCLAGSPSQISEIQEGLRKMPGLENLAFKESFSTSVPFLKLKIKLKREIIPMGLPEISPQNFTGKRLPPEELKKWLQEKREVTLLDTRNRYEIQHGTFEGAIDLQLDHFRHFPEKFSKAAATFKDKPLVMFCTGGIRCEKATAWALQQGFQDVYQLEGGILGYFEKAGRAHFHGKCFVFDEREAV